MKLPLLGLLVAGCLLAACSGITATPALPTPPPPATLTRVPTLVAATATPAPTSAILTPTLGISPTQASLFPPVSQDDWQDGPAGATATIIVYSDFQCALCAQIGPVLVRLRQEYPDDLRIVFRQYPLPQHDKARMAAAAAEAAGAQGKFWEMHNLLFKRQAEWTDLSLDAFRLRLTEYAQELNLDVGRFADVRDSPATQTRLEQEYQAAVSIPLPGTPFVLFNGAPLQDERMFDHWALSTLIRLEKLKARQFAKPPPDIINPFKAYTATLTTDKGVIIIQLFAEKTPLTVNNFVFLARQGWYDGVTFHRVIPGFAAQSGDPSGTGYGGPGYFIPNEIVPDLKFDGAGWVGMANSGPDTNGSQFFITLGPTPDLDGKYTLFGKVVQGLEVVQSLTPRDPNAAPEAPPGDTLTTVTIEEQG